MANKKKIAETGFLTTAAHAIGSTLGQLAVKTGVVPAPVPPKKKTVAKKTPTVVKKKTAPKKAAVVSKKKAPSKRK